MNCAGRTPDNFKELIPIFIPKIEGNYPDIIAVGLQEIVKLNVFSIIKGKDRSKVKEWEQWLSLTIDHISENMMGPNQDP